MVRDIIKTNNFAKNNSTKYIDTKGVGYGI